MSAAAGVAGLGYYLAVTGKLTADTGWVAGCARSARSAVRASFTSIKSEAERRCVQHSG